MSLKPYYDPLEKMHNEKFLAMQREQVLWNKVFDKWPERYDATISIDNFGLSTIRAFIYLPEGISKNDTKMLIKWLKDNFGNGKAERIFREKQGRFAWVAQKIIKTRINEVDWLGHYDEIVFLERVNKLDCTIKKVKKTIEVFEADCK